jgi:hypothetical protein
MSGCRRCEIDLQHCHGTLVRHHDGTWECTAQDAADDPACGGDPATHDFALECAQEWAACCGPAATLSDVA